MHSGADGRPDVSCLGVKGQKCAKSINITSAIRLSGVCCAARLDVICAELTASRCPWVLWTSNFNWGQRGRAPVTQSVREHEAKLGDQCENFVTLLRVQPGVWLAAWSGQLTKAFVTLMTSRCKVTVFIKKDDEAEIWENLRGPSTFNVQRSQ